MMKTTSVKVRKRTFRLTILFVTILVIIITAITSYYILVINQSDVNLPDIKPSATPTPAYLPYLTRPASYVGVIESMSINEITITREDQSKVLLTVNPNVPIYQVVNRIGQIPDIITRQLSELQVGDTLSVYADVRSIKAIFLLNSTN